MINRISRTQYYLMIPNLLYGKAIGITAGVITRIIGADVWSCMLIGFIIGTAAIALMTYVSSKFPTLNILDYSELLVGKWITKVLALVLCIFFAYAYTTSANVITLHIQEYFLRETPFWLISFAYTLLCMYGLLLGIEVCVRFSLFGFLSSLLLNFLMLAGTFGDFDYKRLLPIMQTGVVNNIINSVYLFPDIAMAVLPIGFLYPLLNNKQKSIRLSIGAMVIGTLLIIVWPIFEVAVMSPETMQQYTVVCMQQIRNAQITKYMPRFELIMVTFFVFGVFIQAAIMFYCSVYSFKKLSGIKKDWQIIIPFTAILSYWTYVNGIDHNKYIISLADPWSQICAAFCLGLPLLLLMLYKIRNCNQVTKFTAVGLFTLIIGLTLTYYTYFKDESLSVNSNCHDSMPQINYTLKP